MSFYLRIGGGPGCNPPVRLDQGLRLETKVDGSEWKPIMFYSNTTDEGNTSFVQLLNDSHVYVIERTYNSTMALSLLPSSEVVLVTEYICGFNPQVDQLQLRWVQYPFGQVAAGNSTVAIDNVTVSYWDGVCLRRVSEWTFEEPPSK